MIIILLSCSVPACDSKTLYNSFYFLNKIIIISFSFSLAVDPFRACLLKHNQNKSEQFNIFMPIHFN